MLVVDYVNIEIQLLKKDYDVPYPFGIKVTF